MKILLLVALLITLISLSDCIDLKCIKAALKTHNKYRKKHHAPRLVHDIKISKVAQAYANKLKAQGCPLNHSKGKYGENLAIGAGGKKTSAASCIDAVKRWYKEVKMYKYKSGKFSMKTGHFTQLVWKNTKKLGMGIAKCKNGQTIIVGNYYPAGNGNGQFKKNVLKA